jgi:phosphate transport system permease protein
VATTNAPAATMAPVVQLGTGGGPRATPPVPPAPRRRRRPSELTATDAGTMVGCAASALALTWLVFARLTDGVGWFGFLLVAYVSFLLLFAMVTTDRLGGLVAADRVVTILISTGAVLMMVPLVWLIAYVVTEGAPSLRIDFFFEDQSGVTPQDPPTAGGGSHAIVGSLQQVGLALAFTVPLALSTAVFLNETRSRFRRPVRIFVDAMSGLPSVVAGLFIYAVFIIPYNDRFAIFGYNGFMASLALAMVMLPTITRTVEVVLRLVPDGLREASLALGASRARTVWSVVLPTARSGMTTAIVLGIARAVGETAPLLFTAFGATLMNSNAFDGPQESMPLFVYHNITQPDRDVIERGFTGAFVLLLIVLGLFAVARFIGRDRSKRRVRRSRAAPLPPAAGAGDPAPAPAPAPQEAAGP